MLVSKCNIAYDKHGNIQRLMRYGITEKVGTPPYVMGLADNLIYTYNGNQLTYVNDLATQIPYAGMQTVNPITIIGKKQNLYNNNGAMVYDAGTDREIAYNFLNLPNRETTWPERAFEYDASGKKVSEISPRIITGTKRRTYVDNVIYNDGQPVYIGLEEGYYAHGEYFTTLRDYQGSICMVLKTTGSTNGAIEVLERNYLDPWGVEFGMASDVFGVQPFKHQGKERIELAGNYTHDHGARMAHNAIGRWTVMDPLMEKYYPVSPYVYCGNNPVSFVDPDGMEFTEEMAREIERLLEEIKNNIRNKESEIHQLEMAQGSSGISEEKREEISRGIISAQSVITEFRNVEKEIQFLRESSQVYDYKKVKKQNEDHFGFASYNLQNDHATINLTTLDDYGLLVHELKHMFDFEIGDHSFSKTGTPFYDITDEIAIYKRQSLLFGTMPWDEELAKSAYYIGVQQDKSGLFDILPNSVKYFPEMYIQRIANGYNAIIRYHGRTYKPK